MERKPNGNLDINMIKSRILRLYNQKEDIHVTVNVKKKKANTVKSQITGVYANFFTVKSQASFYVQESSISYVDILINNVSIEELI